MLSVFPSPLGPRARSHRGNLYGGAMNMSMQRHQQCETLEEKEHKRWLAHKDAALAATFPKSLDLNGISIPIFKYEELVPLGPKRLRMRALNMRDLLQATKSRFFEHHTNLVLNPNQTEEILCKWMIDVQVTLAAAVGFEDLDHAAFGAPAGRQLWEPQSSAPAPQQYMRQEPAWSQHGINDGRQPEVRPRAQMRDSSPPRDFPWSQHGVNGGGTSWRDAPPTHQGFSLVPPHLQSGQAAVAPAMGRYEDAAQIRYRGQASAVYF